MKQPTRLTRKELIAAGAVIQETSGIMAPLLVQHTGAYLDGVVYKHESNDYQEGAGNHKDVQLFRLVESLEREPVLGGVRYYGWGGKTALEIEYPTSQNETSARNIIKEKGLRQASLEGIHLYILGSESSLKEELVV